MMPHPEKLLAALLFAAIVFSAAAAHAGDATAPQPVLMTGSPLTAKQAREKQQAWARRLGLEAVVENSIGMQLCVIPPGKFPLGSPRGEADRKPGEDLQIVTHSQPFLIGRYEVTQGQWERVMGPIRKQPESGAGDRFPVYNINHDEASAFCRKLTQLDRKAGKLPQGFEYRLPTDAEWEYACRAGTLSATYFGDKLSSRQANFDGGRPYNGASKGPDLRRAAKVGSYPANAWRIHDMHGNLCEWCLDWYYQKAKGGVDPVQLKPAAQRLIRDGRHSSWGRYCRSANRYYAPPGDRRSSIGFRPVLTKLHPSPR